VTETGAAFVREAVVDFGGSARQPFTVLAWGAGEGGRTRCLRARMAAFWKGL
jgi:hypothetical protein